MFITFLLALAALCISPVETSVIPTQRYQMNLSQNELIEQFFSYLSYIGNADNNADVISLQNYVTDDFIIQSNNEILCRGIVECMSYINQMHEKYKHVSYSDFLETPIISTDKAVVHFHVKCVNKIGESRFLDAIAILTFQNGKIKFWKEVFQTITEP